MSISGAFTFLIAPGKKSSVMLALVVALLLTKRPRASSVTPVPVDAYSHIYMASVDENLFYKGVDKRDVHDARLHQTHSLSDSFDRSGLKQSPIEEEHPPFPFDSGNTLLALTRKHNVGQISLFVGL